MATSMYNTKTNSIIQIPPCPMLKDDKRQHTKECNGGTDPFAI